jgi:hypothetical protein
MPDRFTLGSDHLGPSWRAHKQDWIQTRLGDLVHSLRFLTPHTLNQNGKALPGCLWRTDWPMVRFQSNYDF